MNRTTNVPAGWRDLSMQLPKTDGWMHSGVAVLADGRLVLAHPEGGRLLLISPGGRTEEVITPLTEMHSIVRTLRNGIEHLWIADNGHRYVRDAGNYADQVAPGRAVLMSLDGHVVQELTCPEQSARRSEGWSPTSVVVDDDSSRGTGDVWVADGYGASILHRFAEDGSHIDSVDGHESGQTFACPHGLMLSRTPSGLELYVADRSNHRLVVLAAEGNYLRTVGEDHLDSPSSMVQVGGRLYVTELFGGIACFENDRFVGTVEASRARPDRHPPWPNEEDSDHRTVAPVVPPGTFNSPHGISSDGTSLFLTEWFIGGRLLQLKLDQLTALTGG
jgi:DNA-binding beta-propeller fold protein YncE